MKYQNSIERIAEAVDELSVEYDKFSETQLGEMELKEYGGPTTCVLIKLKISDFPDEKDLTAYGIEIIRILNAYMPEVADDPTIAQKFSELDAVFIGKPLLPQRVVLRQNSLTLTPEETLAPFNKNE